MEDINDQIINMMADFFGIFGQKEAFTLLIAIDRETNYNDFLKAEAGFNSYKLAILDKGIQNSPYQNQVENYPEHLKMLSSLATPRAKAFPHVGELPEIDEQALSFIHPDIKEACICLGGNAGGLFKSRWLGRNSLDKCQYWSSTKVIAILNIICSLSSLNNDINTCQIRGDGKNIDFNEAVEDVITYAEKVGSSNALSAMFKCFQTYVGLESWLKEITGNNHTEFQGLYGEEPFIISPEIVQDNQVLLSAVSEIKKPEDQTGENVVTAYDLTRIMSMVGWYYHLPEPAKLPGMSWKNLQPLIRNTGKDSARYVDVALEKLGIQNSIKYPVILSKLGFGYTKSRKRTELTYTCFTQFEYQEKVKSIAMTLRGAKALGDCDREAVEIDARMAAEVTEIIRLLVTDELV
ncbi:hypothetical protein Tery_0837 [Trichodesmium erythraeum IMS101]|uniref:Uncharacterized protein n=1 Tax=Trichodesmium erythraeum (strain IMS101) TaxID=203124 RepID=Q117S4_TRIEI|nr:hypothetical protein [Trichodesmium erythraeum GBRTRLIN201]